MSEAKVKSGRPVRVGVAEIGSGDVRWLIADLSPQTGLTRVETGSGEARLIEAMRRGGTAAAATLAQAQTILAEFRRGAARAGVEETRIFGTEALRRLAAAPVVPLSALLDEAEVLSTVEEARCSLIAGLRSMSRFRQVFNTAMVMDQGRGSLEVAVGSTGEPIVMTDHASLNLGTERLVQKLEELHLDLAAYTRWVRDEIADSHIPERGSAGVILQGSVVTKAAWLTQRRNLEEPYDPARVQGVGFDIPRLMKLADLAESIPPAQWGVLRRLLGRRARSDELERHLSGSIVLREVLSRVNAEKFAVSASGTRYGVAWDLITRAED